MRERIQFLRVLLHHTLEDVRWRRFYGEMRPRLYVAFSTIVAIATVMNVVVTVTQAAQTGYRTYTRGEIADAIESLPSEWTESIGERRARYENGLDGGISGYRAELERQLASEFRPQADALAEKIRQMNEDEWRSFLQSQAIQFATGKAAGLPLGAGLLACKSGLDTMKCAAGAVSLANNAQYTAMSAYDIATAADREVDFAQKQNLLVQEMERLLETELGNPAIAEPLWEAKLVHRIRFIRENNDYMSDGEYRRWVERMAIDLDALWSITKASGAGDSMWNDYRELAQWLAGKAGREIADTAPPPTPQPKQEKPGDEEKPATVSDLPQSVIARGQHPAVRFTVDEYSFGQGDKCYANLDVRSGDFADGRQYQGDGEAYLVFDLNSGLISGTLEGSGVSTYGQRGTGRESRASFTGEIVSSSIQHRSSGPEGYLGDSWEIEAQVRIRLSASTWTTCGSSGSTYEIGGEDSFTLPSVLSGKIAAPEEEGGEWIVSFTLQKAGESPDSPHFLMSTPDPSRLPMDVQVEW